VKRLKSITNTEPREQFATVIVLVKDGIDPSIISEGREDIGAAKPGTDATHSATQGTEAAAQEAKNNADGGKATTEKAKETVISEVPGSCFTRNKR
jgi:hypothetical protein